MSTAVASVDMMLHELLQMVEPYARLLVQFLESRSGFDEVEQVGRRQQVPWRTRHHVCAMARNERQSERERDTMSSQGVHDVMAGFRVCTGGKGCRRRQEPRGFQPSLLRSAQRQRAAALDPAIASSLVFTPG